MVAFPEQDWTLLHYKMREESHSLKGNRLALRRFEDKILFDLWASFWEVYLEKVLDPMLWFLAPFVSLPQLKDAWWFNPPSPFLTPYSQSLLTYPTQILTVLQYGPFAWLFGCEWGWKRPQLCCLAQRVTRCSFCCICAFLWDTSPSAMGLNMHTLLLLYAV